MGGLNRSAVTAWVGLPDLRAQVLETPQRLVIRSHTSCVFPHRVCLAKDINIMYYLKLNRQDNHPNNALKTFVHNI